MIKQTIVEKQREGDLFIVAHWEKQPSPLTIQTCPSLGPGHDVYVETEDKSYIQISIPGQEEYIHT